MEKIMTARPKITTTHKNKTKLTVLSFKQVTLDSVMPELFYVFPKQVLPSAGPIGCRCPIFLLTRSVQVHC